MNLHNLAIIPVEEKQKPSVRRRMNIGNHQIPSAGWFPATADCQTRSAAPLIAVAGGEFPVRETELPLPEAEFPSTPPEFGLPGGEF